jgi:heptosyltransferase-2
MKTWPASYWKNLISMILQKTSFSILILGGPSDDFCQSLLPEESEFKNRVFSLQGKLSLLESAAAITFCKTLIAADTGLLHMAESLGQNVVAIAGPTHLSHAYRKESVTLTTKLWCQPCTKDGSGFCIQPTYQKCMVSISPEEVHQALLQVVDQGMRANTGIKI